MGLKGSSKSLSLIAALKFVLLLKINAKTPTKPKTASFARLFFSKTKTPLLITTKSTKTKGKKRLTNKCACKKLA